MDLERWKSTKTKSVSSAGWPNSHMQSLFSIGLILGDSLKEGHEGKQWSSSADLHDELHPSTESCVQETATGAHFRISLVGNRDRDMIQERRWCPQEQCHVRPILCKSRLLPKGSRTQITSNDKCLCRRKAAASPQTQIMQQARKRTYHPPTWNEVRQASFIYSGKDKDECLQKRQDEH